jgi:hypothetical protein
MGKEAKNPQKEAKNAIPKNGIYGFSQFSVFPNAYPQRTFIRDELNTVFSC